MRTMLIRKACCLFCPHTFAYSGNFERIRSYTAGVLGLNVRMMHQNEKTNRTLKRPENRIDRGLLENLTCTKVGDGRKQANKPRKQCQPLAVHAFLLVGRNRVSSKP